MDSKNDDDSTYKDNMDRERVSYARRRLSDWIQVSSFDMGLVSIVIEGLVSKKVNTRDFEQNCQITNICDSESLAMGLEDPSLPQLLPLPSVTRLCPLLTSDNIRQP